VIGPNGAGKTTLLAAVMGLLPSTRTLRFEGEDLRRLDVEARSSGACASFPRSASCSAS
jgi:branched-chain amino acid transport system ATP-binding protein